MHLARRPVSRTAGLRLRWLSRPADRQSHWESVTPRIAGKRLGGPRAVLVNRTRREPDTLGRSAFRQDLDRALAGRCASRYCTTVRPFKHLKSTLPKIYAAYREGRMPRPPLVVRLLGLLGIALTIWGFWRQWS
jgi:hypothetical protein